MSAREQHAGAGGLSFCSRCLGTGWIAPGYYVCDCRAGDHAWARWEGMTIDEYDELARGTSDYHGDDPAFRADDASPSAPSKAAESECGGVGGAAT